MRLNPDVSLNRFDCPTDQVGVLSAGGLGVTRNTVARWERDEVSIREPMARLIRLVAKKGR